MRRAFSLLCFCMLVISCDPMRRINMRNTSGEKAEIIWTIKEDSINSSPFFISNSKEVKFELHPHKPGNLIRMSFGVGTWKPSELLDLVDDLEALEIHSAKDTLKLTSTEEIMKYLLPRRREVDKSEIELVIKK